MSSCTHNPNKYFFGLFQDTDHEFEISKIEKCEHRNYQYNIHYKCKHCGIRRSDDYVKETREILDWLEQEEVVRKLRYKS